MLKNADLDAKIGLDTEENEPSEICGISSWYMYLRKCARGASARRQRLEPAVRLAVQLAVFVVVLSSATSDGKKLHSQRYS